MPRFSIVTRARICPATNPSHTPLPQPNLQLTKILLRSSAIFKPEEGSSPSLLLNRFLRGHEALHYGGSELPVPLERLYGANYMYVVDGRPWNRFHNSGSWY
jgi:hypothetical protein